MSEKVLVIDDDIASGKSMMWAMEAMGCEVHLVHDGHSALHEVRRFTPDVVLCDIQMPGMLGWEVCERMRADPRLTNTLFIAQTGLDSSQFKERSRQSGFHHHLVKPIDINALMEIVYVESMHRHGIKAG